MADQTVIPFFRSTYEDVLQDIRTFEVQNHLYFNHSTRQAGFNKDTLRTIANAEKAITIRWKDPQPNSQPFLRDDGYPFYICGRKRLVCHHGPDTKLGSKAAEKEKMDKEGESDHNFQRRRHINQPSKKVDCPAAISIRHIIRFHDFQVPADAQSRRKNAAKRLKSQIDNGEDVHHEHRFYVHFPSHKDHQNHLMGPAAGLCQPMASALKERVRELVHQGVQQPHQVLEHLQIMVMNEIFKGQVPPPRTNAQYWPSYITVYNLIYSLSKDLKNRKTDIPNLENTLDEWQVKLPGLKYHLQTGGVETNKLHYKDTPFLMVMQTAEQRHLLKRYGNYVVCLDATYKTTMYDLPLYFMAVPTNAIYMVVAAFIPKLNTSEGISQAINILKDWNPGWLPAKVMTDYCSSEIDAVRKAFPETSHRLCKFHRKQAWSRWMREKNRVPEENRVPLLTLLERIAVAPLPKSVDAAIQDLKESPCWTAPVSEYLERYWLNKTKMWCEAYDTDFHRRVNTNNGLERQNELLKATYFRNFRGKQTLNMLLHILLNDFYPERWRQYLKANIAATHLTKPYNTDLVSYLHNRPKFFVDHVKKNHEKSMVFAANDIYTLEPGTFHVNSEVESGLKYRVCFGPDAPSCECRDWHRHNMPCKHMCAIFRCIGSWPFNKLAAAYTSSPFLTLDDGVINEPLAYHGVPAALPAKKTTTLTNRTTVTSQTRSPSKALQILQSADITGGSNRGKKCRDLLKQLNNLTYLTKDQTILINLADELEVLVGRFYNKIPSLNGITLLPATQKRKRRPKVVKPKKRCSTTVAGLGICLACEIKNFLEDAKIGPDGVLKCVWQGFPHGAQQCVHEVLMYIAREINRITQTSDQHGAFHEVFGNSGFSQMTCGGCKEPGQTIPEVWTIWTVPMAFSVNAAVEKLFQREHIPVYHCDSCKQDTSAFKETVLHKPPNKLVLHLNRFMSNGQKNIGSMPVEENVVVPIRGGVTPYKISGIVCHLGNSVAAGHYIAYVKREGLWVFFDDEKEGKVVNWMSVASQEAYLILYDQDTSADTVLVEDTPMPEPMLKPQVTRSVPKEVRDEVHRLLKLTAIKEQTKYVGTCPGSSGIDAINAAIVKYFSQEELTREQHTGRGKVVVCLPYVQLMVKEVDIYIQRLVTGNIPQSESMMHSDFLMGRFEVMKKGFGMGYVSIVTETYLHMLVMRWFKRVPTNENEPVTSGHYMQFNRWEGTDVVQAALNKYRKDNISEIHTVYLKVVTKEVMVFLVRQLLQVTYQETWTACQRAQGNAVRDVMNTALIIERERLSAAGLCDV